VWGEASGSNRNLALSIGAVLMGAGLLAQLFPEASPETPEGISRSGEAPPDRALESKR
jgi:hypothetical protein